MVTIRYGNRDKAWAYATGFDTLNDQAKQWIALYAIQRKKALSHCGSCWAWLKVGVGKQGKKVTYCPKGCVCHCADKKPCLVHLNCNCLYNWICEFHETKRPDVAVALYNALPPNDYGRIVLKNGFDKVGIEYWKYKQRGRRPKELKILPVAAVAPKEPLGVRLSDAELKQKMAAFDSTPFRLPSPPETGAVELSKLESKPESNFKPGIKPKTKLASKLKAEPGIQATAASAAKLSAVNNFDSENQHSSLPKQSVVRMPVALEPVTKQSVSKVAAKATRKGVAEPVSTAHSISVPKTVAATKRRVKLVEPLVAARFDLASELDSKMPSYKKWLSKQLLSANSCRNYISRIVAFIEFLKENKEEYPPLSAATKDLPVRDLRLHLKKKAKLKPATLNSYLSAIDNFYGFLEIGKSKVKRDELPQEAPQGLSAREQKKFLRAVELTKRVKDRAIATLLFYTGMRLSECTDLELSDVFIVGRKARAVIRSGKGGKYREVPLNSFVCSALEEWLHERKQKDAGRSVATALFLNPQGNAMLPNSVYEIVRKIGRECGLELSPHTLRHALLTNLIRKQNDVVLVADIAGHRSLNTTKRYTLPSAADKAKALEGLLEQ